MGTRQPPTSEQDLDESDEELVRQLASGRQEVLAMLYQRYAPVIFGLAARSLDETAAEEIVQDVFVNVWRNAATFDPARGPFRPWIFQIAHWRILNELRSRRRQPRMEPDPEGVHLIGLTDAEPEPDEAAWRSYRRSAIQAAIQALPPPQRQALSLAFFEELTHAQVAGFLNLPLGTAKTRIRAGLHKLRPRLAPLVLVALAVILAGGLVALAVRERSKQAMLTANEQALRVVTSSDVVARRLTPTAGVPGTTAKTHAIYRTVLGSHVAVLTFDDFTPAPSGRIYQAWTRHGGIWTSLGTARIDAHGDALLLLHGTFFETAPDALEITLEPAGGSSVPTGPVVVAWLSP